MSLPSRNCLPNLFFKPNVSCYMYFKHLYTLQIFAKVCTSYCTFELQIIAYTWHVYDFCTCSWATFVAKPSRTVASLWPLLFRDLKIQKIKCDTRYENKKKEIWNWEIRHKKIWRMNIRNMRNTKVSLETSARCTLVFCALKIAIC